MTPEPLPASRPAGIAIALASVLSVGFMMIHPTVNARDPAEFVVEAGRVAVFNGIVHGTLIALLAILFCGFTGLASRLGMHFYCVRAGLVAYGLGAIGLVAAAVIDGFVVIQFASRYEGRSAESLEGLRHGLVLCHTANHACAQFGVVALSIAITLWSLNLIPRPGLLRWVGALGCVAGILPVVALFAGYLPMNVHGMLAFLFIQTVWSLAVAMQLVRNRI